MPTTISTDRLTTIEVQPIHHAVSSLFKKLRQALGGEDQQVRSIRNALEEAGRHSRTVELIPLAVTPQLEGRTLTAAIELVREADVVISQPMIGGRNYPLAKNEGFRLVVMGPEGPLGGQTKALGRIKIPAGGGKMLYGYRLEFPEAMSRTDRRDSRRFRIEKHLQAEVELFPLNRKQPVRGTLIDLSITGLLIRGESAEVTSLIGKDAVVKVSLPDPVGDLVQVVSLVRCSRPDRRGTQEIAVQFKQPIPAIEQLIHQAETGQLRVNRQTRVSA